MTKITLAQKLRYKFDNTMSRGAIALIMWLAIVTMIMIIIGTSVIVMFKVYPEGAEGMNFLEAFWQTLMRSMDPGTLAGDEGWPYRLLMFLITIGGIFIVSILIGILTSGIEGKLEELRKGKSFVVESDHQLILGWSSKIFTIVSELAVANENQKKPCIVILADEDKTLMEDEIRTNVADLKNTKVVCRSGNPNDLNDLAIVNPSEAKSIIILSPENLQADPDAQTIKNILALTNNPNRKKGKYHIVAEMRSPKNLEIGKIVGKDEVELLLADDLISRIMVQTCRQVGLSVVYTELTGFDGDEIYFNEEPKLIGKSYGEAIFLYKDSSIIGIQFPNDEVKINPPMDTIFEPGSKVIGITEDDDTLIIDNQTNININEELIKQSGQNENTSESTLIFGWNKRGNAIIRELDNYVQRGSTVKIVSHYPDHKVQIDKLITTTKNIQLEFVDGDTTDRSLLDSMNVDSFDHILVLSYFGKMDLQAADSQTLITLLHLRDIADIKDVDLNIVSEIMDVNNRELASVTKADDFVVSDKMISQLMSQVSENKYLMNVFNDIFDADGSEIYLKPISDYVEPNQEVSYYTLMESAKRKNETAIGYRIIEDEFDASKSYGVVINPLKTSTVKFKPEDRLIVFAED